MTYRCQPKLAHLDIARYTTVPKPRSATTAAVACSASGEVAKGRLCSQVGTCTGCTCQGDIGE